MTLNTGETLVASSNPIQVDIDNPCPMTQIMSNPVPDMAADIGGFASENLRNYAWPWADTIDFNSQSYGIEKCGLKIYSVTFADEFNTPAPFMRFRVADGNLVMEPLDGRDVVGTYMCRLHAYMEQYPTIETFEDFRCDIPDCRPNILPNGARGPNLLTTYWGVEVASFDIGSEIAKFGLDPTCGLSMNFRVIVQDVNNNVVNPREVDCSDLTTCYVEKCNNGPSTVGDGDCLNLPFNIYYTVTIQAYLSDNVTTNEAISFPVQILDPCAGDKLSFSPGIDSFAYMLYTPSNPAYRAPVIQSSTFGLCPMSCTIQDNAFGQDTVPSVMSLVNSITGEVMFDTGSKSFRGATLYYKLTCVSQYSQVQQGTIVNTFEV